VRDLLRVRRLAAGLGEFADPRPDDYGLAELGLGFFASTHELVITRRHYVADASSDDQLCSGGDLSPEEHAAFLAVTLDTLRDLAEAHPFVRYVSVFQNWLAPAGASLEHLHKQLVGIDELGPLMTRVLRTLDAHPDLFNTHVLDPARADDLVIASNAHAVAVAGVGHRYPTVELYSTSSENLPWEHAPEALRAISDLLHACHAGTGRLVPTNEEWHYRPPGTTTPMPWRINLKWRVSTLAGFEGGTKINVNTISPFDLRARMVDELTELRANGRIAALQIGDECSGSGPLRYREG
jgi:galactose-1-phosphate uridylyltransferase